jgi:hypothetical protein
MAHGTWEALLYEYVPRHISIKLTCFERRPPLSRLYFYVLLTRPTP